MIRLESIVSLNVRASNYVNHRYLELPVMTTTLSFKAVKSVSEIVISAMLLIIPIYRMIHVLR